MKIQRLLIALVCLLLCFSFASCVKEESEETLETPPYGSFVEYKISDDESIRFLTDYDEGFGEWVKGDNVSKIYFSIDCDYWGLFAARYGIKDLTVLIYELEDFSLTTSLSTDNRYIPQLGKEICRFDEGLLNSKFLTMTETGEVVEIKDIIVTENYEGFFDWASDEWKAFCDASENEIYTIESISLEFSPETGLGEWIANGTAVPIKAEFDTCVCAVKFYDVSDGKETCIFVGNGYIENGSFIIDQFQSTMFYENTVKSLILTKTIIE